MERKTALITGFTGQDGTFLTQHLLERDYQVIGMARRISTEPPRRVRGNFDFAGPIEDGQLVIESGDLLAVGSLMRIIKEHRPDEVYNLAAQSHVAVSFEQPELTTDVNYGGLINLMTALDEYAPDAHLYQASTSEMYGNEGGMKNLDEQTPFNPNSPYAIAKLAAHYAIRSRRATGKFACAGILFNHESEIRGGDFVTQKIIRGLFDFIETGQPVELGNINTRRDWGYAADYVEAMHLINTAQEPDEFVVGTGEVHTIRQFAQEAVKQLLNQEIRWENNGVDEVGKVAYDKVAFKINPKFYRPNDVFFLRAHPAKAKSKLGWKAKTTFPELINIMLEAEKERRK